MRIKRRIKKRFRQAYSIGIMPCSHSLHLRYFGAAIPVIKGNQSIPSVTGISLNISKANS